MPGVFFKIEEPSNICVEVYDMRRNFGAREDDVSRLCNMVEG